MNTKDMTPEQLRIACAEKCGRHYRLDNTGLVIYTPDGFIQRHTSLFCLRVSRGSDLSKEFTNTLLLQTYPDYEHDMNACMGLIEQMEEEWEKDKINNPFGAPLLWKLSNGDGDSFDYDDVIRHTCEETPQLAIMRAFLITMKGE